MACALHRCWFLGLATQPALGVVSLFVCSSVEDPSASAVVAIVSGDMSDPNETAPDASSRRRALEESFVADVMAARGIGGFCLQIRDKHLSLLNEPQQRGSTVQQLAPALLALASGRFPPASSELRSSQAVLRALPALYAVSVDAVPHFAISGIADAEVAAQAIQGALYNGEERNADAVPVVVLVEPVALPVRLSQAGVANCFGLDAARADTVAVRGGRSPSFPRFEFTGDSGKRSAPPTINTASINAATGGLLPTRQAHAERWARETAELSWTAKIPAVQPNIRFGEVRALDPVPRKLDEAGAGSCAGHSGVVTEGRRTERTEVRAGAGSSPPTAGAQRSPIRRLRQQIELVTDREIALSLPRANRALELRMQSSRAAADALTADEPYCYRPRAVSTPRRSAGLSRGTTSSKEHTEAGRSATSPGHKMSSRRVAADAHFLKPTAAFVAHRSISTAATIHGRASAVDARESSRRPPANNGTDDDGRSNRRASSHLAHQPHSTPSPTPVVRTSRPRSVVVVSARNPDVDVRTAAPTTQREYLGLSDAAAPKPSWNPTYF
jgi:hypothetical protein